MDTLELASPETSPLTSLGPPRREAIAGIPSQSEAVVESFFPSIVVTRVGQVLGGLYESLPFAVGQIRWSYLLFVLPTAPLAVLAYFFLKVAGPHYTLTTQRLQRFQGLSTALRGSVDIDRIGQVDIEAHSRQAFFRTGNIRLISPEGQVLATLEGLQYPERVAQVIRETLTARQAVARSLARIQSRQAAT